MTWYMFFGGGLELLTPEGVLFGGCLFVFAVIVMFFYGMFTNGE